MLLLSSRFDTVAVIAPFVTLHDIPDAANFHLVGESLRRWNVLVDHKTTARPRLARALVV
jgi:hypothetical protein